MIRLRDVVARRHATQDELVRLVAHELGVDRRRVRAVAVARRSLDARRRPPRWVLTVDVELEREDDPALRARLARLPRRRGGPRLAAPPPPRPAFRVGPRRDGLRPLVVGLGPAGLFATLTFLEHGVVPDVVERGRPVEPRARDVARFFRGGELDPESNVQYGEGGAGTFSDGKLTTRRNDPLVRLVVERFVEFGAPERILVEGRPHIGTDKLRDVLVNLRATFERAGVRLGFERRVTGFAVCDGRLAEVRFADGGALAPDATVLATGHSARDVYRALAAAGVPLAAKGFAVGARVEHPQTAIDVARYGCARTGAGGGALPPADYALTAEVDGRGVYSFCMCPGGRVMAATSAAGCVVTNGMSASTRGGWRANAGLVVTVRPEDTGADRDPLAGLAFQERLEERAFAVGGGDYRAPAQRLVDFLAARPSADPLATSYRPGVRPAALDDCLPPWVVQPMRAAIGGWGRTMPGFVSEQAVLIGVESRTSSPVRIPRHAETGEAIGAAGLYPTGEGAGYAGGIVTAALDGIRAARAVLARLGVSPVT